MATYNTACTLKVGDSYYRDANISTKGGNSAAYSIRIKVKLNSQDPINKTSNITITSYIKTNADAWGWYDHNYIYMERYLAINGTDYGKYKNRTSIFNLATGNKNVWVKVGSYTTNVQHNADGSCYIYTKEKLNTDDGNYSYVAETTTLTSYKITLKNCHKLPAISITNTQELNDKLSSIGSEYLVPYLSTKKFTFNVNLYDNATISKLKLINSVSGKEYIFDNLPSGTGSFSFEKELKFESIATSGTETVNGSTYPKTIFRVYIEDNTGSSSQSEYKFLIIPYELPNIIETDCCLDRDSNTPTRAILKIAGTYSNQRTELPNCLNVYYKSWKVNGGTEPASYDLINTISDINNVILEYSPGVSYAENEYYYFKFKFLDEFNSEYISSALILPINKWTWAETDYGIDAKMITINGKELNNSEIVITSTNKPPTEDGSWELIDKEFSSRDANLEENFTINATNTTSAAGRSFSRHGHSITFILGWITKVALSDTQYKIGKWVLEKLGVSSLSAFNQRVVGYSDGGNCVLMMLVESDGTVSCLDVIPEASVKAGSTCYLTFTVTVNTQFMLDEACNKFYWKRIN